MPSSKNRVFRSALENVAIGERGTLTLYWCREHDGMASTQKEHVLRHLKNKNWQLHETPVKMIPFNELLAKHAAYWDAALLLVDAEGWDDFIIQSIDYRQFTAGLLVFESLHSQSEQSQKTLRVLSEAGYQCFQGGMDCIAVKTSHPRYRQISKAVLAEKGNSI